MLNSHTKTRGIESLRERFGERLSTNPDIIRHHATVEGFQPNLPPDAVLFAESTAEVRDAVRICAAHDWPIIPYGAGSSLEGHVLAAAGGLCLDLSRMDAVLKVYPSDLEVLVQAGVTRKKLNASLRDQGLFFPVDPGADATLGGMTATGASGTTTIRYGGMRANVLGLTVVLANGEIIHTGGRARKSSAGYDLTSLFIGSEGTLGVITEIRLRLYGTPEETAAAVCPFESLEGAVSAVIDAVASALPVARIELLDALQMTAVNRYAGTAYLEQPTLFLEFHGSDRGVADAAEAFKSLAADYDGGPYAWATNTEERTRLWDARHKAYFAALALSPGKPAVITDVCVPVSELATVLLETRADIDRSGLIGPILGHVGDGNFHSILLVDPEDPAEVATAKAVSSRMVERALAVGGTCTGEHGVGLGKIDHLKAEQPTAIPVMALIKRTLDPHNLMNPGKVVQL